MDYVVLMDVSGDWDLSVSENAKLEFIPMDYSLGGDMRTSNGPETTETLKLFYNGQRKGDLTRTSQIAPYLYVQYMTPYLEKGLSVLCLCLSSGLSSTYQSACMAREELKEKFPDVDFYPVDTLAATGGMGVLAERALRNQAAGMSIEENYADLNEKAKKILHWFMVQDLMYLKRGGRVSAATAVVGTALNIKPVLIINKQGKLDTVAKKRGNAAAAAHLVEQFAATYDENSGDVVYIIDADDQDLSDKLTADVLARFPNAVVRHSMLSPIIGAHTGPGMAAICYIGK